MSAEKTVQSALTELSAAITNLENAIDMRIERQRETGEIDNEVKRVHVDRARLAHELDQAEFRANRLEEVNRGFPPSGDGDGDDPRGAGSIGAVSWRKLLL